MIATDEPHARPRGRLHAVAYWEHVPMAKTPPTRYLIFDVESAVDGQLVAQVKYPDEDLTPAEATARYRQERLERYGTDFLPYTYQFPVAIAIAKVAEDLRLIDLVTLDAPKYRPHVMTQHFWRGWEKYGQPTLVSFNGRTFDVPLLELAAFRYGIGVPRWFNLRDKSYEQRRNRYNIGSHFDLQDLLTNFSASMFAGGLNLAANILGKPGKMDIAGHMVQDLYDKGDLAAINGYCQCDVLDTYFVFLRASVMTGDLDLDDEQRRVDEMHKWLEARVDTTPAFGDYLECWGQWENPWTAEDSA